MRKENILIIIVILIGMCGWVLGYNVLAGCLPYKYKAHLFTTNKTVIDAAVTTDPEWCRNKEMTSKEMERNKKGEKTRMPFLIHTFNHTNSNAIRGK